MAAAALKNHIARIAFHDHNHGNKKQDNAQDSADQGDTSSRQNEKQFIVNWEEEKGVLEANEISVDPELKRLGHSSSSLRVGDFNLIKTLGTGTNMSCAISMNNADWILLGTFARVWLAQVAKPRNKDEEKVFALKVLRKADGVLAQVLRHYSKPNLRQ